jgi:ethanolamine utilization protein EutN
MTLGTVKGSLWATKKDERLNGHKLMVVHTQNNNTVIAIDTVGSGVGDQVILCYGHAAKLTTDAPVDAAIIGIVDSLEIQ